MSDAACTVVCAICQDGEEQLTDFTTLVCGHQFHSSCLARWLWQKKGAMSCPCCRTTPLPDVDNDSVTSETLSEYSLRVNNERARSYEDARVLRNVMRRKLSGRRNCNKQRRYKDLSARIKKLRKDELALRRSIQKTSSEYKAKLREVNADWQQKRRSLYDSEKAVTKETKKLLSQVEYQRRKAVLARREVIRQLLVIGAERA
jgi:hypothetical protein